MVNSLSTLYCALQVVELTFTQGRLKSAAYPQDLFNPDHDFFFVEVFE